jgi:hypothetical protein
VVWARWAANTRAPMSASKAVAVKPRHLTVWVDLVPPE